MVPRSRCQLQGPSGQREGVLRRGPAMRTKSAGVRFDVVWGRVGVWRGSDPCNPRRCHPTARATAAWQCFVWWVAEVVSVLRVCRSELTPSFLAAHVSGACPGAIICRRANCAHKRTTQSTLLFLSSFRLSYTFHKLSTRFPPTLSCVLRPTWKTSASSRWLS